MDLTLSDNQRKWKTTSTCPLCGKRLWATREYVDGHEVKGINFSESRDEAAVSECGQCKGRWAIYKRDMLIEVIEGRRESAPAFTEEFTLDNTRGRSNLKRTKSITHEWSTEIEVGESTAATDESSVRLGGKVLDIGSVATNTLSSNYKVDKTESRTFSESVDFEVPPGTCRLVTLTFRHIWQLGEIRLTDDDGAQLDIPYKVSVGFELDVRQDDS
ncbi:MAG: hypothetical protein DLM58_09790 [Pseudonocardiales bacterium]|nr:MAG: hypothetical protein DLM58_09790 [Pseudonocardiales bacterium]